MTANGGQQQALLDVRKQLGKTLHRGCGDQATGCTNQQLTDELRHGVSKTCGITMTETTKAPLGEPSDVFHHRMNSTFFRSTTDTLFAWLASELSFGPLASDLRKGAVHIENAKVRLVPIM